MNTVLMLHADVPLPIADIARAAGLHYTPAASALATLEKRGVALRSQRAGHDEFAPDRESVHYPAALWTALVDLPLDDALQGAAITAVYAYGSMTEPYHATRESDLDLLIVGDVPDREALVMRLAEVGRRLARAIDAFVLTPEHLDAARTRDDAHVAEALRGVRIRGRA